MEFKVGDRVRSVADGGLGFITSEADALTVDVKWDDNPAQSYRSYKEDLELVEDQPNRTYYEPLSEVVSGFADTPLTEDEIKQVRTLGGQLGVQTFESNVHRILNGVAETVVQKNVSYGDSALNPIRVFSKADRMEQLFVRLDDKLSRVQRGSEYPGDDTLRDIIGYCTLVLIARETE